MHYHLSFAEVALISFSNPVKREKEKRMKTKFINLSFSLSRKRVVVLLNNQISKLCEADCGLRTLTSSAAIVHACVLQLATYNKTLGVSKRASVFRLFC